MDFEMVNPPKTETFLDTSKNTKSKVPKNQPAAGEAVSKYW
jgi:hypothetical protein